MMNLYCLVVRCEAIDVTSIKHLFGETIMHDSHFELLIAVVAIVMTVLLYRLAVL